MNIETIKARLQNTENKIVKRISITDKLMVQQKKIGEKNLSIKRNNQ